MRRHRSTIFRALRRNHYHDGDTSKLCDYWNVPAQRLCDGRRYKDRKLVAVTEKLKIGWTSEQIAGWMCYEGTRPRVCQETIAAMSIPMTAATAQLWRYLPTGRRRRRGYRLRKRPPPRFAPELSILFRPDAIAHRREFGHWEADLVRFRQKYGAANITTMVERMSRFLVVIRDAEKRTKPVMARVAKAVAPLPPMPAGQ